MLTWLFMYDLVASSGEFVDCSQLNTSPPRFQAWNTAVTTKGSFLTIKNTLISGDYTMIKTELWILNFTSKAPKLSHTDPLSQSLNKDNK